MIKNIGDQNLVVRESAGYGSTSNIALEKQQVIDTKNMQTASIVESNSEYVSNDLYFWGSLLFTIIAFGILVSRFCSSK